MRAMTAVLIVLGLAISGCAFQGASAPGGIPRASGDDHSISAQVDCGEEGVANVRVEYGVTDDTVLVGRPALTQSAGGQENFDVKYGNTPEGFDEVLTLTTEPTTGTCTTTLTDYESGNVMAEKSTSGKAVVTAVVPGGLGEREASAPSKKSSVDSLSQVDVGDSDQFGAQGASDAEQEFLAQISDPYWAGSTDSNLIDLGNTICQTLEGGSTTTDVLLAMQDGETEVANHHVEMLHASVTSFCPEYLTGLGN